VYYYVNCGRGNAICFVDDVMFDMILHLCRSPMWAVMGPMEQNTNTTFRQVRQVAVPGAKLLSTLQTRFEMADKINL